jgi:hypothetical protein
MNRVKLFIINIFIIIIAIGISCTSSYDTSGRYATMPEEVIEAKESITDEELLDMLSYIASDELEGRNSGEEGNELAAQYIADEFEEYGLLPAVDGSYFQEFSFQFDRGYSPRRVETSNIIGYLPGNHPSLKSEVIVVGAHMDHVGYGRYGSRGGKGEVHNGADDNGSGTVAVLELAEAFAEIKDDINRTFVFIAFSGEEMGLKGSYYYVRDPVFPLDDTIFMLNLDMVGWLREKDYLYVLNVRSVPMKTLFIRLSNDYPFEPKFSTSQGSDHYPFYRAGIPVAFLHTGIHAYYHTNDDDVERIDFDGLEMVTEYAFDILWQIDVTREPPK